MIELGIFGDKDQIAGIDHEDKAKELFPSECNLSPRFFKTILNHTNWMDALSQTGSRQIRTEIPRSTNLQIIDHEARNVQKSKELARNIIDAKY